MHYTQLSYGKFGAPLSFNSYFLIGCVATCVFILILRYFIFTTCLFVFYSTIGSSPYKSGPWHNNIIPYKFEEGVGKQRKILNKKFNVVKVITVIILCLSCTFSVRLISHRAACGIKRRCFFPKKIKKKTERLGRSIQICVF